MFFIAMLLSQTRFPRRAATKNVFLYPAPAGCPHTFLKPISAYSPRGKKHHPFG
ncbi:hypothetical protein HMPREF7215_2512 [Pyramidobacter piscolens W5455]|uniref:Uncharacterized protein n=1 Tax=Pyramidobacter piscolens W5455 TaxID=352165 RepID=A0ABM9ZSP2_9BACT|nr:hypothetical protein HMPREF7215_2512 [Pyramidobacter piscolens W5455]